MKRNDYTSLACDNCRRRKTRCTGERPCRSCAERDRACEYTFTQQRGPKRKHNDSDIDNKRSSKRHHGEQPAPAEANQALVDKVATLERMVFELMPNKEYSEPSPIVNGDQEASDIFQPPAIPEKNLALSSQLALLSGAPARPPVKPQGRVAIHLPDPMTSWSLLKQSFECTAICYSLVDPSEMEVSIRKALLELGYSHTCQEIMVDAPHLPLVAVLMHTLAIGRALEVDSGDNNRPGWAFYSQGCLLAHRLAYSGVLGLPLVQIHVLSAIYLVLVETLRSSSQAVVAAYQFATMMKLNDQNEWPTSLTSKERAERKRLWWILFYLDRRIAQKCGLPYHIRDVDIAVDDFSTDAHIPCVGTLGYISDLWLQALIDLGRLFGRVWDGLFAASSRKLGDWEEIEVMDARAANLLKRLPPELQWCPEVFQTNHVDGLSDTDLFRRLVIFTNVNLLRALIHHSPLHPPSTTTHESTRLAAQIAVSVMDAHLAFVSAFPFTRFLGYFSIVTLVECMYHVVPALHEPSCEDIRPSLESSLQMAYEIIQRVAERCHVARHALSALERVGALARVAVDGAAGGREQGAGLSSNGDVATSSGPALDGFPMEPPDCSSLLADIPYLALSATELNRTVDSSWPTTDDEWQALFATQSIP